MLTIMQISPLRKYTYNEDEFNKCFAKVKQDWKTDTIIDPKTKRVIENTTHEEYCRGIQALDEADKAMFTEVCNKFNYKLKLGITTNETGTTIGLYLFTDLLLYMKENIPDLEELVMLETDKVRIISTITNRNQADIALAFCQGITQPSTYGDKEKQQVIEAMKRDNENKWFLYDDLTERMKSIKTLRMYNEEVGDRYKLNPDCIFFKPIYPNMHKFYKNYKNNLFKSDEIREISQKHLMKSLFFHQTIGTGSACFHYFPGKINYKDKRLNYLHDTIQCMCFPLQIGTSIDSNGFFCESRNSKSNSEDFVEYFLEDFIQSSNFSKKTLESRQIPEEVKEKIPEKVKEKIPEEILKKEKHKRRYIFTILVCIAIGAIYYFFVHKRIFNTESQEIFNTESQE